MLRIVTPVASTLPHLSKTRSWMIVLLILHFLSSVQGWKGPQVPITYCQAPEDCAGKGWTDPLPACEDSRCICPSQTCAVFTNGVTGYLYFCGPCGMLGSQCGNVTDCVMDWQCVKGFCQCDFGSIYHGICLYYESVPTSVSSVVLVFILILIVALQKLISSRKSLKKLCCKSSSESEDDEVSRVVASNPRSDEKSAAFTIANSDFMATSEDTELAWAIEFSRRLTEHGELDALTLSSTMSSLPGPDPRFTSPRPPPTQPGTSGWRQSPNEVTAQRRSYSRTSLASTSSSRYHPSSSSSSGTVSSHSSSITGSFCTFPSTSLGSSLTTSSRPLSSFIISDEISPPPLESVGVEFEDDDFETTRV